MSEPVASFFNNESVAAFLGALCGAVFAVITVVLTDRRRDRQNVETIRGEVETTVGHAKQKLETVRQVLRLFRTERRVRGGEIIKFDVAVIRELKARVLHLLPPRQRQALDAVLFRMEGTDSLLDEVRQQQKDLRPPAYGGFQIHAQPAPNELARHEALLSDVITNLKVLVDMAGKYANGDYAGITQGQFNPADYADPAPMEPPAPPAPPA